MPTPTIIYNTIGKTYDLTRQADDGIVKKLVSFFDPDPKHLFLDIGCGSGNYTGGLAKAGLNMEGLDLSDEMLNKAKKKYPAIPFHQADAAHLPFKQRVFAGVTCILATHLINDKEKLFSEAYRIIGNGKFIIFTATPDQMSGYWLNHYFPNLMQLAISKMSSFENLKKSLEEVDFHSIQHELFYIDNKLSDLFLHSGKYRPEIYLDENVREGISAFQLAEDQHELQDGLERLAQDIATGEINKIIARYENNKGDNMFVIGIK